ncbi:MAG: hypothetical protein ACE5H0_04780 [Bacteroidota bacterium]
MAQPFFPSYASGHQPSSVLTWNPPWIAIIIPLVPIASRRSRGVFNQGSDPEIMKRGTFVMSSIARSHARNTGYCAEQLALPDSSKAILAAEDHSITFLNGVVTTSDPHGDAILDEIDYYVGSVDELADTTNDIDRFLPRGINDETFTGKYEILTWLE